MVSIDRQGPIPLQLLNPLRQLIRPVDPPPSDRPLDDWTPSELSTRAVEQRLATILKRYIPFEGRVRLRRDHSLKRLLVIGVGWEGPNLVLSLADDHRVGGALDIAVRRAPWALGLFTLCGTDMPPLTVDASDGQLVSDAMIGKSSCDPNIHLVPDYYFFFRRGFEPTRKQTRNGVPDWEERSIDIVWRGRLTGDGIFSTEPRHAMNGLVRQRLRFALLCQNLNIDAAFTSAITPIEKELLNRADLMGEWVNAETWRHRKFAIDIDGFTNTSDNLFMRLLQGCCVIKIESQMGFRQWYYDQFIPWTHFVPVRADMSDLEEKLDWCMANQEACREIARKGYKFAHELSWERVLMDMADDLRSLVGLGPKQIAVPPARPLEPRDLV